MLKMFFEKQHVAQILANAPQHFQYFYQSNSTLRWRVMAVNYKT